ncbi:hypothetical protein ACFBZI_11355 [Moraxella sp. ZJ142]|uniref:hypothetical protein n=1 Tax=Moraxella marmotae TaxID=3344520 RepID=UPI0035D45818
MNVESQQPKSFNGIYALDPKVDFSIAKIAGTSIDLTLNTTEQDQNQQEVVLLLDTNDCMVGSRPVFFNLKGFDKFKFAIDEKTSKTYAVVEGTVLIDHPKGFTTLNPSYAYPVVGGAVDVELADVTKAIYDAWSQAENNIYWQLTTPNSDTDINDVQPLVPSPDVVQQTPTNAQNRQFFEQHNPQMATGDNLQSAQNPVPPTDIVLQGKQMLFRKEMLYILGVIAIAVVAYFQGANAKQNTSSSVSVSQTSTQMAAQADSTPNLINDQNGQGAVVNADVVSQVASDTTREMLKQMGVDPDAPKQDLGCLVR